LQGLPFGRAQRQGALPPLCWDGGQGFFGGDNNHRDGQQGQGQRSPQNPAGAIGRGGERILVEELVQRPADYIHKKPEAEDAKHNRGHAGEVVDRNPDGANQRTLLGILAQIQGGDHAKRDNDNAHDDDHHDRPENGGEHAALGIGLARVFPKEFPKSSHV